MRGWLGTLTALPMSWQSEATTISSSAPARSASVAVCSECVSWSTAKPSVIAGEAAQQAEHRLGDAGLVGERLLAITPHCSAVDSSMRVKVPR